MESIDDIRWTDVNRENLKSVRSNPDLHKFLISLPTSIQYHTSKRFVYIRRPDGRVTVHPKDGGSPNCYQCMEEFHHISPVAFVIVQIENNGNTRECRMPYCVNEDVASKVHDFFPQPF